MFRRSIAKFDSDSNRRAQERSKAGACATLNCKAGNNQPISFSNVSRDLSAQARRHEKLRNFIIEVTDVLLDLFGDNLAISVKEVKELDRLSTRCSLHPDKRTHNGYGNLFQGDDSRVFRGNHHRRPLLDNTSEVCLDGLGPPQAERRPAA